MKIDKEKIQPLKGFRDFLPEAMLKRQAVFTKIRNVFERFGFLPMSTPALEYKEVLTGKYGEEGEKLLYSFTDNGGREVAMRYDLTVPLARLVAQYGADQIPLPFKRYQIDPVWRADKPQKGRFREFYQCDIDVVGSKSLVADAEVIACLLSALKELGVPEVVVKINNRKLLRSLIRSAGVEEKKTGQVIRALDKLEKAGEEAVRGELAEAGIQTAKADELFEKFSEGIESPEDVLNKFGGLDGAGELAEVLEAMLDWGIKNFRVELSLARGLDYYTGTIFEIILPDAPQFGSICGGGRYDELIGLYTSKSLPVVGGSIGIDRLIAALEELELLRYDLVTDVLVCNLSEKFTEKYLSLITELREAGLFCDFYYEPGKLEKQLKYADRKNINFAVLIGEDEEKKSSARIKNMKTGDQELISQDKLVAFLKKSLAAK